MSLLEVLNLNKEGDQGYILKDINFTQQPFNKIAIAGETGSGKSTLLKIIAGLIQPDSGAVYFKDASVLGPAEKLVPGHAGIAYLSQHFELPKFLRVEQVLSYANTLPNDVATALYELCRIDHLLLRKTTELSGGERQRIALAKLLTSSPQLLLLDEPFSNLDVGHKDVLKNIIDDIAERLKITFILVSHDPADTLSWADEILVMKDGQIIQQASPETVYRYPVDEYTAGLFGKFNLISEIHSPEFSKLFKLKPDGKSIIIRPEDLTIVNNGSAMLTGKVNDVKFFGSYYELDVSVSDYTIVVKTHVLNFAKGDTIYLSAHIDKV